MNLSFLTPLQGAFTTNCAVIVGHINLYVYKSLLYVVIWQAKDNRIMEFSLKVLSPECNLHLCLGTVEWR